MSTYFFLFSFKWRFLCFWVLQIILVDFPWALNNARRENYPSDTGGRIASIVFRHTCELQLATRAFLISPCWGGHRILYPCPEMGWRVGLDRSCRTVVKGSKNPDFSLGYPWPHLTEMGTIISLLLGEWMPWFPCGRHDTVVRMTFLLFPWLSLLQPWQGGRTLC